MPVVLLLGWAGLGLLVLVYSLLQYSLLRAWARLPDYTPPADYVPHLAITVLLPVRNESAHILSCLQSLTHQDYPPALLEIIVIDDHSTDATAALVAPLTHDRLQLLHLADHLRGRSVVAYKKAALSWGVQRASGTLIVTTDADCTAPSTWLRTLAYAHECTGAPLLLAPVIMRPAPTGLVDFQALDLLGYMLLTGGSAQLGVPLLANGANLAFTRHLFDTIGGYAGTEHRASGDDVLLLQKIKQRGTDRIEFVNSPTATVTTLPVLHWRALAQQRLRWAAKTGAYRDGWLLAAQSLVFALCMGIVGSLIIAGVLGWAWALGGLLTWAVKTLIDYYALQRMAVHFRQPFTYPTYLRVQAFHTAYICIVGVAALLVRRTSWKGRQSR